MDSVKCGTINAFFSPLKEKEKEKTKTKTKLLPKHSNFLSFNSKKEKEKSRCVVLA